LAKGGFILKREFALEFIRVTEYAALGAAQWIGRGDKMAADDAATEGMRRVLESVNCQGTVVIGEGEMDEAPMLYIGEKVGNGNGPEVDIAVDPLEGTNLTSKGIAGAIAVLAVAPKGCLLHAPDMYMDKIVVGPPARGKINLDWSIKRNLENVAGAMDKAVNELTVVILDRERHEKIIKEVRDAGAMIRLISDGDVSPAVAAGIEGSGVDMLLGIGGAPEGILAAAAIKCLGGDMQGRLIPEDEEQNQRCHQMGIADCEQLLTLDDMVKGSEIIFACTAVTDGAPLRGVRFGSDTARTHSLVMRGETGTIRFIEAIHSFARKPSYHVKGFKVKAE
jgi:fructose-1,6-bisphosphatase II